ncbi:MAG: hypothetical protein F6K36_16950 [Symploca sp. SIO3C6]|uniref:Uncharacterized protein n=1 Tax=Symploca sp. SIO1C4 TaxID=2607765 RepID=A0A6B3NHI5_9CYAN|nr:hypothetical protein [Symploca sp. SIO3C6]NER30305.1 hypothetical protein [Symploca sp. SIO1C4]NET03547.1 hypothetical protein [Symploca sp. SIO2B6]
MTTVVIVYSLFFLWMFGVIFPPKKEEKKPKTPEEQLGDAVMNYLSSKGINPEEKTTEKEEK